ncbi:hypothetical protein [Nocardia sp. NPDC057353]|uniref:hypothetical protein n=1 Tax=Nocardia sp. NPDC057353 TaxID=3346104 RepID=UPI00363CD0A7
MVDHREEVVRKLARLRELGAEGELERRWEEGSEDEEDLYNAGCLSLPDGVLPEGEAPAERELRALYRLSDGPRFGMVALRRQGSTFRMQAVDVEGRPIHEGTRLVLGAAGDGVYILLDSGTGAVTVYDSLYFKYGQESGVRLECDSLFEFVDTAALGPRYRELWGPAESEWWAADPWWNYLVEIGFAHP